MNLNYNGNTIRIDDETGMMVGKCQNLDDNNNEELEMINFTGFYLSACEYDLDNFPIVDDSSGSKVLEGFGTFKKEFKNYDFTCVYAFLATS